MVKMRAALLGLLLVLTLVVCHAALEGTGPTTLELAPAVVAHQPPSEAGPSSGYQAGHSSVHAYGAAAFFTVLLGSLLWLSFRRDSRRRKLDTFCASAQRRFGAELLCRKFFSPLILLQIFRL